MATALDVSNVEKKFRSVSQTQESIQSLSLWVIHHKAQHEKIVDLWFQVLKKSKIPHRLTLFYLCNDIVQTCKKKHAIVYKDAFKELLKDAVLLVRDNSIRNNIERIFTIWEERGVYDKAFLEELSAILNNTKIRAAVNSKLLAEFKPHDLVQLILKVKKNDEEVEVRNHQLVNVRVDTSNIEMIKQLKDRSQCKDYCQQFEDSCSKLQTFVDNLEKSIKDKVALIEMLEQSEIFYDTQYGEAKIVANAYKNFGTRVNNLRRRLEEHMKALPDPYSPVPSPTVDAPSPGNTPPQAHADILESMDMDLSEEDDTEMKDIKQIPGLGSPADANTGSTSSHPLLPGSMNTDFLLRMDDNKNAVTTSWAGSSVGLSSSQSGSGNLVQLTEGSGTPVNDEGNSTPVQDEQPDSTRNPIEFLTQLINQSQKNVPSSSSFFQNLTALTEKVKQSKIKIGDQDTVTGDQTSQNVASGEEFSQVPSPPAPPTWESWNAERETPSYVPNTRPTPTLPFNDVAVAPQSEPYSVEDQSQTLSYRMDTQQDSSLYSSVQQRNNQSYPGDTLPPGQQPYNIESKPSSDSFSSQSSHQSALYGSDPQNTSGHTSEQAAPTQSYGTNNSYVPTDQQSPLGAATIFPSSTVPPPPPAATVAGNSNNGMPPLPGQSHYTTHFYQDSPASVSSGAIPPPVTPPVSMSEAQTLPFPPPPPPPASTWPQPVYSAGPSVYIPPPTTPVNAGTAVPGTPPYQATGCTSSINSSGPQSTPASFSTSASGVSGGSEFRGHMSQSQQADGHQSHGTMHRTLAPVPMAGFDLPKSDSEQNVEVSTIPTMVGKGRPNRPAHAPRPPAHPPSMGANLRSGQFSSGEEDQQDFVDKLKHKSYMSSASGGPSKGIPRGGVSHGIHNLRTLTDHEPAQYDGSSRSDDVADSGTGSVCGASDADGNPDSPGGSESQGQMKVESCSSSRQRFGDMPHPQGTRPPLSSPVNAPFHGHRPNGPWPPFQRDPRFPGHRMPPPPFDSFRDSHGRPFSKRHLAPFEFRHQRFPRY